MLKDIVVVRGGGDIATAIAHKLHRSGFKVLILETALPLAIRRTVAFAQAIFDGEMMVEEIKAKRADGLHEVLEIWNENCIPIMVDDEASITKEFPVDTLIDATLAKKNIGTNRDMASITIAVGPGFEAESDVDLVIESNRGHHLGRLIFKGRAEENTGIPGLIHGFGIERVIKAPSSGKITNVCNIGDTVKKGDVIASIEGQPVEATIDGVLRGLIMDGMYVKKALKIADIDPRCKKDHCYTISDKARAIAGGVLEGILYMRKKKNIHT
ncbi:MAG: EF2563 family selenium-dependent molybdenum hydroxylase system protein [Clostridiaceae bacterium]|nr:EF2563 family selenium-dependent molybdenum hydroxylase system protein [Clostridiaceae bacterium]